MNHPQIAARASLGAHEVAAERSDAKGEVAVFTGRIVEACDHGYAAGMNVRPINALDLQMLRRGLTSRGAFEPSITPTADRNPAGSVRP